MKNPNIHNLQPTTYNLTIGWLYPDLMSIYGDRGNIIALQKRCEWRGIGVEVVPIDQSSTIQQLKSCDLLVMGGAQDRQQAIVAKDLQKKKSTLSEMIESSVPGLYICGGFQYLGKYYKEADGTIIDQLGILDVWTENPGGKRLIGNISIEADSSWLVARGNSTSHPLPPTTIVGFENHGGRTRLGSTVKPLGRVIKGYGSNAEDHTEGAVYKNSIGTYLHGPILPKNPFLADWLIQKALEKKYNLPVVISNDLPAGRQEMRDLKEISRSARNDTIVLSALDDTIADMAREGILKKM